MTGVHCRIFITRKRNKDHKARMAHVKIGDDKKFYCGSASESDPVSDDWTPEDHPEIVYCEKCFDWYNSTHKPIKGSQLTINGKSGGNPIATP
jgi:hypothetical protein